MFIDLSKKKHLEKEGEKKGGIKKEKKDIR